MPTGLIKLPASNMEDLGKLSDDQLIHLFQNNRIDHELKALIISEIDRRDLKKEMPGERNLDFNTKLKIVITSGFVFKNHLQQTNELLINGKRKEYKQYWKYFTLGLALNIVILLLITKYIITPYFFK